MYARVRERNSDIPEWWREVRQGGDVASPLYCCLLSLSEDAEEVDKQVDEVEVEGEST